MSIFYCILFAKLRLTVILKSYYSPTRGIVCICALSESASKTSKSMAVINESSVMSSSSPSLVVSSNPLRLIPCYSASLCKISIKSGNQLLSYGQKRFLIWRLSAILNLKKIKIVCHVTVINFQMCWCVRNFIFFKSVVVQARVVDRGIECKRKRRATICRRRNTEWWQHTVVDDESSPAVCSNTRLKHSFSSLQVRLEDRQKARRDHLF